MKQNNKPTLKESFSRFNFKLVIALAVNIILFLGVFLVVWEMGYELVISILYGVIALAAALWYIIINKGMIGRLPTADELPPTWDKQQRQSFLDDMKARRKKSKIAMLILVPMIVTFFYQLLSLYLFPHLALTAVFAAFFQ